MRAVLLTMGIILFSCGLLLFEKEHKKLNNFWDELWIKFDDSVLQIQNSSLTWINKSKLISLKIINIFFEKQIFSFKNYYCSLLFINMATFFHFGLLCITFIIRYGSIASKFKLHYGLTFYIPMFKEINISTLSLSFKGFTILYWCIASIIFFAIVALLLLIRFSIHKYPLWCGGGLTTAITIAEFYYKWQHTGSLVIYNDTSGNFLENVFTPYPVAVKVIIFTLRLLILPLVLMTAVYILRRIFYANDDKYRYIYKLTVATIIGYITFCYTVLFYFYASISNFNWWVGCADLLPTIFIPIAALTIMILSANIIIFTLNGLLNLINRIIYIIPKYKVFTKDKTFISTGSALIFMSQLNIISIKEILKLIIDIL